MRTLSASKLSGKPTYVGAKLIILHFGCDSIFSQAVLTVSALIVNEKSISSDITVLPVLSVVLPVPPVLALIE